VIFLGKIDPAKRFDLIAQADVCALPLTQTSIASRYTSPLKLFEYMSMSKPLVLADLPSIREVWRNSEAMFEVGNPVSCAEKIVHAIALLNAGSADRLYDDVDVGKFTWLARGQTIRALIESRLVNHGVA